ncbi:MAG: hypothetical protein AB7F35_29725 [Acetobacteraceae bacterium]
MTPHYLIDQLEHLLRRLERDERAAAQHIALRLMDEAKEEADAMDTWSDREERRNHV